MNPVPGVAVDDVPPDATLLDVREDDEWVAGHAPDARHVSMGTLTGRLAEIPADDPVYVICRSGARSAQVVTFLNQQGRASVNVEGGMQSWAARGRPVVAESGGAPQII